MFTILMILLEEAEYLWSLEDEVHVWLCAVRISLSYQHGESSA